MTEKRVLVCPMDWGLGHASRSIPVINAFRNAGCRVIIAASGPAADLIRKETGGGEVIPFPGLTITYSRFWLSGGLLMQGPAFLHGISREKKMLRSMVEKTDPHLIVSDNRYGLVHDRVPSVLITHQLKPALPVSLKLLEKSVSGIIRKWVLSFQECWIPDYPENSAAGELISGWEGLPGARFTGWLSRLSPGPGGSGFPEEASEPENDVLFLLSGPEPHRTILEKKIIGGCISSGIKALIARGLPGESPGRQTHGNTEVIPFLATGDLMRAIGKSRLVVCRSGYSSVMDLLVAGKNAMLIPTPGQPEQEYLGKWLGKRGWFRIMDQKNFDIGIIMRSTKPETLSTQRLPPPGEDLLQKTVDEAVRRYT
jgi:UDP:flavonoid glycosyltransferase YjiC (YdhE family)